MSDIKIAVCADPECRSDNVELTHCANWNIELQKWVKDIYQNGSYCFKCSKRDYGFDLMTQEELDAEKADEDSDSC
jgi:hypothetical protein